MSKNLFPPNLNKNDGIERDSFLGFETKIKPVKREYLTTEEKNDLKNWKSIFQD